MAAIIGDAVDGKGKGKGEGKGDSEAPPHEEIMAEIRAIRKLVGAPQQTASTQHDQAIVPESQTITRPPTAPAALRRESLIGPIGSGPAAGRRPGATPESRHSGNGPD